MIVQPYAQPLYYQEAFTQPSAGSDLSSSTNKKSEGNFTCATFLKAFGIALLGAVVSVAISVPVTIALRNASTTTTLGATSATTVTGSTAIVTTATTVSTTSATTSASSTTTSATTVTTATTATTTTTTTTNIYYCAFPCLCAGVSPFTAWQSYAPWNGMFMNINTSRCNFTQTPLYFTSIAGNGSHSLLFGYGAIYYPTSTSFTVYIQSLPGWSAATLMSMATANVWDVNWFALFY